MTIPKNQDPQRSIRINLAPETERVLKARATEVGQTLETFLEEIANREAEILKGGPRQTPSNLAEFERRLDELSEGLPQLPTLPADFSRTDIYGEHPDAFPPRHRDPSTAS